MFNLQTPDVPPPGPLETWTGQHVLYILSAVVSLMFTSGFIGNYVMNRMNLKDKAKDKLQEKDNKLDERQEAEIKRLYERLTNLENKIEAKEEEIHKLQTDKIKHMVESGTAQIQIARMQGECDVLKAQGKELATKFNGVLGELERQQELSNQCHEERHQQALKIQECLTRIAELEKRRRN